MSRLFYHVMQDNLGNLLFDVSGTMRIAGTGTAAIIYGDEALTIIIPNPMTNHLSFGSFKCYLGPGTYDFYMAKSGYTFETLTGVQGGGSMANQDANAVAITGGTATLTSGVCTQGLALGPGQTVGANRLQVFYNRTGGHGIVIQPTEDTGSGAAVFFVERTAAVVVGTITTTNTTTAYNTTSDARLKAHVEPLTGALDVVRMLKPVSYVWKADGSPGLGLLADEVAEVVDGVTTGEKDAVDDEGNIQPQMIDYSKLVPYLIGAVKELTHQVEILQAQLAAVGA